MVGAPIKRGWGESEEDGLGFTNDLSRSNLSSVSKDRLLGRFKKDRWGM